MRVLPRTASIQPIFGIGLESLPWIGLAIGSAVFLAPPLQGLIPAPQFLLPLLTLFVGGLAITGRRWIPSPSLSASDDTSHSTLSASSPSHSRQLSQVREHGRAPAPQQESRQDALTGLADRSLLLSKVDQRLESPSDENPRFALLSISLDEYRDVTDSFGYDAGQQLVTAAATRIDETISSTALVARIAEDAFAVLLDEVDAEQARERGQNLLQHVDEPFQIGGHDVPIEASAGLATRPSDGTPFSSAEEMLQASYSAMHHVQRHSDQNLKVFQGEVGDQSQWLRQRERLRQAIRQEELTLHYQPVVHLATREIVGAEALVRWNHPERGLLPPSAFIPLAEETGLVGEIDRWVFDRALQRASRWTRSPDGPVDWISVNVSPQSAEGGLQEWCCNQLRGVPLTDGGLHLEITERWALEDEQTVQPLRDEGLRLSIDDFGTGYSSLRYLRSLDADALKIDRQFIQDLGRDPKTTAIVQFLLNLSLRLDVQVIAEGVETAEQEATLRDLGCPMAQGFYFSEPVPPEVLASEDTLLSDPMTEKSPEERLQPA